jgi:serine/threonine protein kinase
MLREAEALARLSDPNVVQVFDVGTYALEGAGGRGGVFIVMELVRDGTLADWLEVPRSCKEVLAKFIAAGRGLAAAHAAGLIHRDFKPTNVLLAGERVLVSDFGLVRATVTEGKHASSVPGDHDVFASSGRLGELLTHAGTAMGTPAYMPPEQCEHGEVTPASDLFGLGVTLYEGLSAMRPFSEGDETATDRAAQYPQLVEDPQPLSDILDVPAALDRVIMTCIQRDPKRRPSSAQDVAVALEGVLESLGTQELYAWPKGLKVRG